MWKKFSKQPSPIQIMRDQTQSENMEYFNYLGSMILNDARCTREIKSRTAMAKVAFNRQRNIFDQQNELKLKEASSKVPHLEHSFVWC